ncbi:MAG: DUF406 family protein [Shewanella sp.]|uniref:DUF406 family protein n=1 Tax=Shewanella sp. TaxID=50422 RepID=UPI003F3FE0C4
MKGIIAGQAHTVNDTCTDCGSFVDIGAVIDEHDTELALHFHGESAMQDAQTLAARASARFDKTQVKITPEGEDVHLVLTFDVSAEKMIFQLQNGL